MGIDSPELERQKEWYIRFLLNLSRGEKVNYSCLKKYAYKAKEFLEAMLVNCSNIKIKPFKKDRYGRLLAIVYYNKADIGAKEISLGLAIVYPFGDYPNKEKYYNLTIQAMIERKGLWNCIIWRPQRENN